jgi:hypothetical protein
MRLRRCKEDRFDFTEDDNGAVFPIRLQKGGAKFGFCPAKATWDHEASRLFKVLELSAITKCMPYRGGLMDQPSDFVDLFHRFVTQYDSYKFAQRQKAMWGDGSKDKKQQGQAKSKGKKRGR